VRIGGGESVQLTTDQTHWASISPDGKLIACLTLPENQPIKLAIVSIDTGKIVKLFDPVGNIASPNFPPVLRWTHDSRNIAYISTVQGVSNIMLQPVDSDKTRRLTDFSSDRIFSFDLSADGAQIVFARGTSRNEIILFEDFSG
jgi:Tol biopolymer transport system component